MKRAVWAIAGFVAAGTFTIALAAPAGKNGTTTVDSGSFGVFMNGRRVATEKFDIVQRPDASVVSSELKLDDGGYKLNLSSDLELAPNGNLLRYSWREVSPGKSQAVVEPNQEFLIERVTESAQKPRAVPFLLPPSTAILDDFFFTHREVLAWKYLAGVCENNAGSLRCKSTKTQFGVIIPRQHVSATVSLEYGGREKVQIHGVERELTRLTLHSDTADWSLWLDDQLHLQRITIAGQNTEIVRD